MLQYLKTGQANSISRQALKDLTGMSDRQVRKEIEKLRDRGFPVCSNSQSKGYYLAETPTDIKKYQSDMRARAYKLLLRANKVGAGYFNTNQIQWR